MSDINTAALSGRIVGDPVIHTMKGDKKCTTFFFESRREFKTVAGSGWEAVTLSCCAYSKAAQDAEFAKDGDTVIVQGRLRTPKVALDEVEEDEFPAVEFVVEDFKLQEA